MTWTSTNAIRNCLSSFNMDKFQCLFRNTATDSISTSVIDKFNFTKNFRLYHWPCFMCIWFLITLIITYSISVGKKHAYKFFPYISDTGTYPPESCIFGQLINIGTLMMVLNMYLRYRQVEIINETHDIDCAKLNRYSMWCAIIGCLGMSIVANFQKMSMRGMHFLGADLVLGGGVLYTILQSKISYDFRELARKNESYGMKHTNILVRMIISGICFILFFILVGCGYDSEKDFDGDLIWWTPEDKGWVSHVIATISEWLIILLISIYILSYTGEFKMLEFKGIQFKVRM